jgi:hypothetical protein
MKSFAFSIKPASQHETPAAPSAKTSIKQIRTPPAARFGLIRMSHRAHPACMEDTASLACGGTGPLLVLLQVQGMNPANLKRKPAQIFVADGAAWCCPLALVVNGFVLVSLPAAAARAHLRARIIWRLWVILENLRRLKERPRLQPLSW